MIIGGNRRSSGGIRKARGGWVCDTCAGPGIRGRRYRRFFRPADGRNGHGHQTALQRPLRFVCKQVAATPEKMFCQVQFDLQQRLPPAAVPRSSFSAQKQFRPVGDSFIDPSVPGGPWRWRIFLTVAEQVLKQITPRRDSWRRDKAATWMIRSAAGAQTLGLRSKKPHAGSGRFGSEPRETTAPAAGSSTPEGSAPVAVGGVNENRAEPPVVPSICTEPHDGEGGPAPEASLAASTKSMFEPRW